VPDCACHKCAQATPEAIPLVRTAMDAMGWVAVCCPRDYAPSWTYTVGLYALTGHPDLVLTNMDVKDATRLLTTLGSHVVQGRKLVSELLRPNQFSRAGHCFRVQRVAEVDDLEYDAWFAVGHAVEESRREYLQVCISDAEGRFYDDPSARERVRTGHISPGLSGAYAPPKCSLGLACRPGVEVLVLGLADASLPGSDVIVAGLPGGIGEVERGCPLVETARWSRVLLRLSEWRALDELEQVRIVPRVPVEIAVPSVGHTLAARSVPLPHTPAYM